ncbi:MAG: SDR family oxidoreductase [Acidobacteriota bacterium]|jgi:gluconate 5-dehydrogenase|nr:SDR family oxidoreductase [Bryobacteraceae bacterium CoA2 C42]MCA2965736.1 SDR family oxidoreductase [Acidobacteriaceae bacterium]
MELFRLDGRRALITGGSRGLGAEMAEGLAEAGASVRLLARREQWLTPAVEGLRARGFDCEGMLCDVTDAGQVEAVVERFGPIDILVNNAGVSWGQPAEQMPLDKWRQVLDTNLTGAFLFAQAAGRQMIARRRGVILNIASIAGMRGSMPRGIHAAAYTASKGGLIALTKELAAKWAGYGIRVNAIAPGYFPSRMTERILPGMQEDLARHVPLGRAGRAGELKGVAVFLCSDAAGYVTGQTLAVDGGATAVGL